MQLCEHVQVCVWEFLGKGLFRITPPATIRSGQWAALAKRSHKGLVQSCKTDKSMRQKDENSARSMWGVGSVPPVWEKSWAEWKPLLEKWSYWAPTCIVCLTQNDLISHSAKVCMLMGTESVISVILTGVSVIVNMLLYKYRVSSSYLIYNLYEWVYNIASF